MTPFVQDTDFTLYVGDVREVLASLPDESVQCVVTSPPYWGLRDYGTGSWDGGDPDCDHREGKARNDGTQGRHNSSTFHGSMSTDHGGGATFAAVCGKCGARRVDQQLGLEPTPELYVENMVAVFREVRRVLRKDGTLWLNIGDSYNANTGRGFDTNQDGDTNGKKAGAALSKRMAWGKPKDLVGIPWRLAFALQADGWYLRSDIIWSKPNPMPESVTDRPTKAHEYVFLLTRSPRYFFDQEAVRENHTDSNQSRHRALAANPGRLGEKVKGATREESPYYARPAYRGVHGVGTQSAAFNASGRNVRSVWEIPTQPFAEAHFATYPQALVERCVKAGCPEWACGTCGKARERIVDRKPMVIQRSGVSPYDHHSTRASGQMLEPATAETVGWSDCGHNDYQPGVVLDPFLGSGTTALVARRLGRRSIGIELNPEYADMAAKRLSQLSLLA